jgi:hypothetical protein
MVPYLTGEVKESPRTFFFYMSDDGEVPLIFNIRRDPFERAQHNPTSCSSCSHLDEPNRSTLAKGSADCGRKRLSVNFVF